MSDRREHHSGQAIASIDLAKTYRNGVEALAGVSFAVEPGEVVGYLGRNGSGKTTTVRILTTLTRPTAGTAWVGGHDVIANPVAVRRMIGVTLQAAALDPAMTGREHLEFVAELWGQRRADAARQARDLLDELGLIGAADRLIGTYSGGMQRRLDLAAALITRPSILFLDEPTTGLDAQSRRGVWDRVRALRDDGAAVLITTQYLEEADVLADRVAVLHAGRILTIGAPEELKARFGTTTLRLRPVDPLAAVDWATGAGLDIRPGPRSMIEVPRADIDEALRTLQELRAAGVEVGDVEVVSPSLEDAYLALTGEAIQPDTDDTVSAEGVAA